MSLKHYIFSTSRSHLDFEFESEGRNGKIKKVVRYSPQNANGITYFNLGFGDLNKVTGKIDDISISDNQDTQLVLATVAATVLEFTRRFPDALVYAKGSTPSRTRLYQMGISSHWKEIDAVLTIYGYINGEWQPFSKDVNFEAFLAIHK